MRSTLLGGAVAAVLAAAVGCGGSDETSSTSTRAEPTTTIETQPAPAPVPAETTVSPKTVDLYFTAGEQFERVPRELRGGGSKLERTTQALLRGPRAADGTDDVALRSQIPEDVRLERVSRDGGTVMLELSGEFDAGVRSAGTKRSSDQDAELAARVGQLTYTLTQLEGVDSVRVLAGGRPVEASVRRADYAKPQKGPPPAPNPRGAKSLSTRKIQKRLAHLRYLPHKAVDGVAGYRTQQAVMAFQASEGLERDGIVGPATTAALADAHRPRPGRKGPSRRIEVYRDKGVALLIEHGDLRRAIHVSAGAPGTPTPAGRYEVFRKELRSWSVPFQVWLPLASYFNQGIAFHEYPDVPPYPASHGCVRVPAPEAQGVYDFASIGTAVVVY
jgi:lipoprotein-anchoring transpeptidase ErfK/SrfK